MGKQAKAEEVTATPAVTPTEPSAPAAPAAPAAAPQAPADEGKDITDALREENRSNAMDAVLGLPSKKKEKPATPAAAQPDAASDEGKDDAPAAPAAAQPAAAKPVAVKIRPQQKPPLTEEDAARIAAHTVAEFTRHQKPAPASEPEDNLPDDLKRVAPVYAEMERLFPDKYKPGTAQRIAKFRDAEQRRADEWEAKNPGNLYNADDEEHAEFYAKHQPQIDADDIEEARFELRYKQRVQRDIEPKLAEAQRTTQFMKAEPVARQVAEASGDELMAMVLPEGTKVTPDVIKEFAEKDPITAEIATEVSKSVKPLVYSMSLLWDGVQKFNEQDQSHVQARKLLEDFEQELSSQDPEQLVDQAGRQWVPLAVFSKMDRKTQEKVFTTSKEHLARYAAIRASGYVKSAAKQRIEIAERYAKSLGYSKAAAPSVTPAATQQPASQPQKISSPSVGAGSPTPPSAGAAKTGGGAQTDPLSKILGL